jgi:hypothetical protein
MSTRSLSLLTAALVLAGAAWSASAAEMPYGTTDRPLQGQRYTKLRELAQHLDQTAKGALEGTDDETRRGTSAAARLLSSVLSFARDAHEFRRLLDDYQVLPFQVPAHVAELTTSAQQVSYSIRAARGMESTHADWQSIVDVLERMRMLLAGSEVAVPAPHVVAALSGLRLQEFQQLADELATSSTRAHESAKRDLGEYPGRGQQFLAELYYFAVQIRGLSQKSHAEIDAQTLGPLVDALLEDARQADRRMRDAQVFRAVWDDSGRSITILHRMANLVRS